ncbi:MAG: peptidase domain-containing ABC transporter [Micavibrio sp.]
MQPNRVREDDFSSRGFDNAEGLFIKTINEMKIRLVNSAWRARKRRNSWETCVCALGLSLEPECSWRRLSESLPYGLKRFGFDEVLESIANMGYLARPAHIHPDEVDERLMPCLAVSEEGHPYVMISQDHIFDCKREVFIKEMPSCNCDVWFFEEYIEGKSDFSIYRRKISGLTWFKAVLRRFKPVYWQVLTVGLFLNLVALMPPLFIMTVYDRVISSHRPDVLLMLAVGVAVALGIEFYLRHIQARMLSGFSSRLDNIVSNQIFGRLINLSPGYIERASVPAQVARLKTFESVRDFFSGGVFLSLLEMPFSIVALIAIAAIAGPLFLVPLSVTILYISLFLLVWQRVKVTIREAARASSARQQFSLETFEKIGAIRVFGLKNVWQEKFQELCAKEISSHTKLLWLGNVGEILAHGLTVLSSVAVVAFGVHLIWAGHMTAGALVATMILSWRVLSPFYSLCTIIPRMDQIRNSIRQINDLMNIEEECAAQEQSSTKMDWKGEVQFVNASLRYPGDVNPVFSGLNFVVKPGELALITGDNGSGKTSLLKMILGMYTTTTGNIQIDGHDIRQINPHDLRHHVSYISQYPHFFAGTIESNLRLYHPLATDKEIEMALKQADVWDDIHKLSQGLQTRIGGSNPAHITSSMAFRLCIARAYLHDAPIMLVDELPNSLINDVSGRRLIESLINIKKGRTVFMVTYKNEIMQYADHLIVLRRRKQPVVGPSKLVHQKLKELV